MALALLGDQEEGGQELCVAGQTDGGLPRAGLRGVAGMGEGVGVGREGGKGWSGEWVFGGMEGKDGPYG